MDTFYFNRSKLDLSGTASPISRMTFTPSTMVCAQAQDASQSGPLFAEVKITGTHDPGNKTTWSFTCIPRSSEDK